MKELIHFAHGNGFPSPCYRQLLQHLQSRFDYCYIDRIGHSQAFPVTDNWQLLVDELITSVKTQSSEPVIALGHSLGGVLSFLAAVQQPSLFKAVILLDSPIIGRLKSRIIRLSKKIGLIDRITPAFRTRTRQEYWPTREQALVYLKSKKLFQNFAEECLDDYIDYGMQKTENGYALRFNPLIEYQIYRTIPHILHQYEGQLQIPAALIYGNKSNVIDRTDLRYMKTNLGVLSKQINGTHMFPMEHPQAAAHSILSVLDAMKI